MVAELHLRPPLLDLAGFEPHTVGAAKAKEKIFPSVSFLPWGLADHGKVRPTPSPGSLRGFLFQFLAWVSLMPTKTQCSALGGTSCWLPW